MAKKKDDFNQIPKSISDQKPGDYLFISRKRKLPEFQSDACGINPSDGIINLDILRPQGRSQGDLVTYSADQTYNYLSQSERYDDSINFIPAYINEFPNKIVYGFCSHRSSLGYWEVTVSTGQGATYINLTPSFLTILCPRPFTLSEFVEVDTDSTVFQHTQIAGNRTVLILPDNVQYPLYDIQTTCYTDTCESSSVSPLIIRIETDNPLVFADLVILNRPIDNFDGLGYMGLVETEIGGRKVSAFYRAPDDLQRAYEWLGTPLLIYWIPPALDSEFVTQYRWQILTPPYTDFQTFSVADERLVTLNANQRYRVATDFEIFQNQFVSYSEPVFFNYPIPNTKTVFADDSGLGLGYSFGSSVTTTVNLGVQVVDESDPNDVGLGFILGSTAYFTIEFGVKVVDESDLNDVGLGFSTGVLSYQKVDLGGVVIG